MTNIKNKLLKSLIGASITYFPIATFSSESVTFTDIAANSSSGIDYQRVESPRISGLHDLQTNGFFFPSGLINNPMKAHGAPGVALLDYDMDGDQDIYVTNGPGVANSLYSNQLQETGELFFIDKAAYAEVALTTKDSSGVCYGDIDNDNDPDILVLSSGDGNTLFKNNGQGKFIDITQKSGIESLNLFSTSCAMGDVNNDGLLDITIANSYSNWNDFAPIFLIEAAYRNQDNQLFVNLGENNFDNRSVDAGITNYQGISWAIALVDYDVDGDVDLIVGDDQGGIPGAIDGGIDTGYVRLYNNDGTGHFTDVTIESGTGRYGAWMGLAFGDFNSDDNMDIFATNVGAFMGRFMANVTPGDVDVKHWNSGWFLGNANGTFTFPNVGKLKTTPFGWGVIAVDYDNDADTDILYHGGMDMGYFVEGSNPGAVLKNDGTANFSYDSLALSSTNHNRRNTMGFASGDLNKDGFTDLVSVSSHDWDSRYPLNLVNGGSPEEPFYQTGVIWPTFTANDANDPFKGFFWSGIESTPGSLSVEISNANNNNRSVTVKTKGAVGLVNGAVVNRDGIGAILRFTPKHKKTVMSPVLGGGSYASQDQLAKTFGLGTSYKATIDVTWPGGVNNRLYGAMAGEEILLPEIPCDFKNQNHAFREYLHCVGSALRQLKLSGTINSNREIRRLFFSALMAYLETAELNKKKTSG